MNIRFVLIALVLIFSQTTYTQTLFPQMPKKLLKHYQYNRAAKGISALIIGVDKYRQFKALPRLKYAVDDAESFAKHLLSTGVPAEKICLLTGKNVTQKKLDQMLSVMGKSKDILYFFYAGHGMVSSIDGFFFVCQNADVNDLKTTAYSMNRLKKKLARMKNKSIVMFVDACHSGAARDADIGFAEDEEQVTLGQLDTQAHNEVKNLDDYEKSIMMVTSCSATQVSREEKGNGLFTKILIEGLQGKADKNKDRRISSKEVLQYTSHHVADLSDLAQRPDYSFSNGWEWEEDRGLPIATEKKSSLKIAITTAKGKQGAVYRHRELLQLKFKASRDCYLHLYYIQSDGGVVQIFPNQYFQQSKIQGKKVYQIPGNHFRLRINTNKSKGMEAIKAIASIQPLPKIPGKAIAYGMRGIDIEPNEIIEKQREKAEIVEDICTILTVDN